MIFFSSRDFFMRRYVWKPLPKNATVQQKNDRRDLCRISAYDSLLRSAQYSDCAPFVGSPPLSVLTCNASHGLKTACPICHWNYCQVCSSSSSVLCVQCNTDPCKGCLPLSYPSFSGWSGMCIACNAIKPAPLCAPHLPTAVCIVCKWNCCKACNKERPMADRVGGTDWYCSCSGASVVIEISDDEEVVINPDEVRRTEIRKEFPSFPLHWSLPPVGADASDGYSVLLPHSSVEFKRISDMLHDATKKGLEPAIAARLVGYHESAVEPRSFKIFDIRHIMDPLKYECYQACMRKMEKINSKRTPTTRFSSCEQFMFHGTKRLHEQSIIKHGFMKGRCQSGLHGDGIYFSRYTLIPDKHAERDGMRLMFVCRVLEGKPSITEIFAKMPRETFDSGGDSVDGLGHKTVIFDDNHVYAEYAVYYGEEEKPPPASPSKRPRV